MRPLLFSLEANARAARSIVQDLHAFALESDFPQVSAIQHLVGNEVNPGPDNNLDPLRSLKLDAAIKIKVGNRALAVLPIEVLAFTCVLANGQALNIGLCRYPEEVQQPSTGEGVKVYDPDCWGWQSSVMTLAPVSGMETCIQSHMSVVGLLRHAEEIGALQGVTDPTDFYRTRWTAGLQEACRKQSEECGAC